MIFHSRRRATAKQFPSVLLVIATAEPTVRRYGRLNLCFVFVFGVSWALNVQEAIDFAKREINTCLLIFKMQKITFFDVVHIFVV